MFSHSIDNNFNRHILKTKTRFSLSNFQSLFFALFAHNPNKENSQCDLKNVERQCISRDGAKNQNRSKKIPHNKRKTFPSFSNNFLLYMVRKKNFYCIWIMQFLWRWEMKVNLWIKIVLKFRSVIQCGIKFFKNVNHYGKGMETLNL